MRIDDNTLSTELSNTTFDLYCEHNQNQFQLNSSRRHGHTASALTQQYFFIEISLIKNFIFCT